MGFHVSAVRRLSSLSWRRGAFAALALTAVCVPRADAQVVRFDRADFAATTTGVTVDPFDNLPLTDDTIYIYTPPLVTPSGTSYVGRYDVSSSDHYHYQDTAGGFFAYDYDSGVTASPYQLDVIKENSLVQPPLFTVDGSAALIGGYNYTYDQHIHITGDNNGAAFTYDEEHQSLYTGKVTVTLPVPETAFGFDVRGVQRYSFDPVPRTPIPYIVQLYSGGTGGTLIGQSIVRAGFDFNASDPQFFGIQTLRPFDTVCIIGTHEVGAPFGFNRDTYYRENWLALDNIQYGQATDVPEPSVLVTGAALLGALGVVLRRGRRSR